MRFLNWLVRRLDHPRAGHVVTGIALVLATPSLLSPLILDDHVIALKARAASQSGSGWIAFLNDCFVFAKPESTAGSTVPERLFGAWWASSGFRFAFWRPVAAATHAIDQLLWRDSSLAIHLHTMAWFAALLVALGAFFRRCAGAWLAPLLFAADLLSAEMAVSVLAYLLGYALFLQQGSRWRRALTVLPYLAITLAWQAIYTAAGYGIDGSGVYIQPLRKPLRYAMKLLERGDGRRGRARCGLICACWRGQLATGAREARVGQGLGG